MRRRILGVNVLTKNRDFWSSQLITIGVTVTFFGLSLRIAGVQDWLSTAITVGAGVLMFYLGMKIAPPEK